MRSDEAFAIRSSSDIRIGINPNGGFFISHGCAGDGACDGGGLLIPGWMLANAMGGALPQPHVILSILEASPLGRMLRNQAMVLVASVGGKPLDDRNVVLQSMVELIQIILRQALPVDAMALGGTRENLIDRAYEYIESNLGDPKLSAQAIAEGIGCSRATLYRLFSQRDTSVAKAVREVRLKRVWELLASAPKEIPIKRIALEVGFADPPNFNRFIRHHFGVPPSLLRYTQAG